MVRIHVLAVARSALASSWGRRAAAPVLGSLLASLLATAGACEPAPAPETATDFPAPPALPEGGIELAMPELVLEPGQDITWCYVPEYTPASDVLVKRALAYQGGSGHHMAVYRSQVPLKPGDVFDCTSLASMVSLLPLVLPDVGDGETRIMPEGFAVRMPAGSQLVLQSHFINATFEPVRVRDVLHLEVTDAAEEPVEASYWVVSDNALVLPEGTASVTKSCTITEETKLVFMLGHMHEWGTRMDVTRVRDGVSEVIYEVDAWSSEFRDRGPTRSFDPADPLVLAPGDRVDLRCTWENDTGAEIRWPKEMCVTLGAYFPARGGGFLDCDEAVGE